MRIRDGDRTNRGREEAKGVSERGSRPTHVGCPRGRPALSFPGGRGMDWMVSHVCHLKAEPRSADGKQNPEDGLAPFSAGFGRIHLRGALGAASIAP